MVPDDIYIPAWDWRLLKKVVKRSGHSKQNPFETLSTGDTNSFLDYILTRMTRFQGRKWLLDEHMSTAQHLPREQFPNIHGLQSNCVR